MPYYKNVPVNKSRIIFPICLVIILLIGAAVSYAPRFLLYASTYRNVDAVVLFLGPDFTARQKEAYRIINEGKADYLIIPAYHTIYKIYGEGRVKYISSNLLSPEKKKMLTSRTFSSFYEDTHIETIETKKMMADFGLKSAIFVSSPYHMRRIRFIVSRVFTGEKREFYFVPNNYEKAPGNFWELTVADWKYVGREYYKMLWFSLYSIWSKK